MQASSPSTVPCYSLRGIAMLLAVFFVGMMGLSSRSVDLLGGELTFKNLDFKGEMSWHAPDHGLAAGPSGSNTPKPEEKEEDFRPEEKNDSGWLADSFLANNRIAEVYARNIAVSFSSGFTQRTPKVPLYLLYGTHRGFSDRLV